MKSSVSIFRDHYFSFATENIASENIITFYVKINTKYVRITPIVRFAQFSLSLFLQVVINY